MLKKLNKKNSFKNNFIPSKRGWKIPKKKIFEGPFRFCVYLKIFRSNKVINITENKTKIKEIITLKKKIKIRNYYFD